MNGLSGIQPGIRCFGLRAVGNNNLDKDIIQGDIVGYFLNIIIGEEREK
jgi:hypothetical protein